MEYAEPHENQSFNFECSAQVLQWLITVFEMPEEEGETFWKVCDKQWPVATRIFPFRPECSDDLKDYLIKTCGDDFEGRGEWGLDKHKCGNIEMMKHDENDKLNGCLCFKCRRKLYHDGPDKDWVDSGFSANTYWSHNDVHSYHKYENTIDKFLDWMKTRRSCSSWVCIHHGLDPEDYNFHHV